MKTNFEQIVDVTKIAVDEKEWALKKALEIHQAHPEMTFEEVAQRVRTYKDLTMDEIVAMAEEEKMNPAVSDIEKTLLIVIDAQYDFHEGGNLAVNGAREDTKRTTEFIYKWAHKISRIMISLDTHVQAQIFHSAFWIDQNGNHPAPYTVITKADIVNGKYRALYDPTIAIEYLDGLEAGQKKQLIIWPYHCIEGTKGWLPEQQLVNMVYFHSAARKSRPLFILKGQNAFSEMYGIFKEEYSPNGANLVNPAILKIIEEYDKIYFLGQAKSHCVLESVKQFLEEYKDRPEITSKVVFVEDCSSCVDGFEDVTIDELEKLKRDFGIRIEKSTEISM